MLLPSLSFPILSEHPLKDISQKFSVQYGDECIFLAEVQRRYQKDGRSGDTQWPSWVASMYRTSIEYHVALREIDDGRVYATFITFLHKDEEWIGFLSARKEMMRMEALLQSLQQQGAAGGEGARLHPV